MNEKTPILTSVEKLRNRFTAEYFSRGAAQYLKSQFDSNKDESSKKLINQIKNNENQFVNKIKKKNNKFFIKAKIASGILIFGGLATSAVILFNKLNKIFSTDKVKKYSKEIDIGDEVINDELIDNETMQFSQKLSDNIDKKFLTPLKANVDFFFTNDGKPSQKTGGVELYQIPTRYLRESQKSNGIIGQVFYNVGLAAIWRAFTKRGYDWVLKLYGIESPESEWLSVQMWKVFNDNTKQFMHIGRDLVNSSMRGAELHDEWYSKRNQQLNEELHEKYKFFIGMTEMRTDVYKDNTEEVKNLLKLDEVETERLVKGQYDVLKFIQPTYYHKIQVQHYDIPTNTTFFTDAVVEGMNEVIYTESDGLIGKPTWGDAFYPKDENKLKNIIEYVRGGWQRYGDYFSSEQNIEFTKAMDYFKSGDKKRWVWTRGKFIAMMYMFEVISRYELYQAIKSVQSTRSLYQDFFNDQTAQKTNRAVVSIMKKQRRRAEQFAIDYAKGQLSIDQFISQMKVRLNEVVKNPMSILDEDIKLLKQEFQIQIPYGKLNADVSSLISELNDMTLISENKNNILRITNESLKENFKVDTSYDRNSAIAGNQYDYQYGGVTEKFYSHDEETSSIFNEERFIHQYLWKKTFWSGDPSDNVWGTIKIPSKSQWRRFIHEGDSSVKNSEDLWGYANSEDNNEDGELISGWMDRDGRYTVERVKHKTTYASVGKGVGSGPYYGGQTSTITYSNTEWAYIYYYEPLIGYRHKNIYETLGKDGKLYRVEVWDYYHRANSKKPIFSEEIGRKESHKSHLSTFEGEYNFDDLQKLYNLPINILEQNLTDSVNYIEKELEALSKEREDLISEIIEKGTKHIKTKDADGKEVDVLGLIINKL